MEFSLLCGYFFILASFIVFAISVISFYLNLIVLSKLYYDFGVFIVCLLFMPLVVSCRTYLKIVNIHKIKLRELVKMSINEMEIKDYFSDKKTDYLTKYEEYIKNIQDKLYNIDTRECVSLTIVDKMRSLQSRISKAFDKLEILKNDYFMRLDAVELDLINKIASSQSSLEFEEVIKFEMLVENLEEQVDAINYYLQAVEEIGLR